MMVDDVEYPVQSNEGVIETHVKYRNEEWNNPDEQMVRVTWIRGQVMHLCVSKLCYDWFI